MKLLTQIKLKYLTFWQIPGSKLLIILIINCKFFPVIILSMILHFSIQYFGTVTTSQGALIIGGHDGAAVATVACYNGTHNL